MPNNRSSLSLGMAVHTPAHGHLDERCCRRFFALANGSVTGLTFHLPKNDMASVGIEDVIGHFVELPPGDFLLFFCKLPDLSSSSRTLGDRVFVTLRQTGGVRHSGKGLGLDSVDGTGRTRVPVPYASCG